MRPTKRVTVLICAVLASAFLSACRANEQNRVLFHEKGVYLGAKDTPISKATLARLRQRVSLQGQ